MSEIEKIYDMKIRSAIELSQAPWAKYPAFPDPLTDESVEAYEVRWKAAKDANDAMLKEKHELLAACKTIATRLMSGLPGKRDAWSVYCPGSPYYITRPREALERSRKDRADKERTTKLESEREQRATKAVAFLLQRGKVAGEDFTLSNAASIALDLTASEKIAARVAELKASGDLIEFSGQNCDDCKGWDGESHRCECGNRRVCWTFDGSFEDPCIYGEAY